VTREKIRDKIATTIETRFSGSVQDSDGTVRPRLDQQDCKFIADLILSEMGPKGLRDLLSKAKNDNAPRS
jgi:hypothetical protein